MSGLMQHLDHEWVNLDDHQLITKGDPTDCLLHFENIVKCLWRKSARVYMAKSSVDTDNMNYFLQYKLNHYDISPFTKILWQYLP